MAGNRNAYGELVRRYEAKVRGYCVSILGDFAEAEDAAQEVFVKAYQSLERFRGDSSFSTWLYRINANHCLDLLRKRKRQKSESWDALLEKEGDKIESLFSASPNVSEGESAELLAKLLEHLPEKSREVLILREVQGLSYQEMTVVLGCSLDAVKARLKRGRQELESGLRHFMKPEASNPVEANS